MKSVLSVKFKYALRHFICGIILIISIVFSITGSSYAAFESILTDPCRRFDQPYFQIRSSNDIALHFDNLWRYNLPELSVRRMDGVFLHDNFRYSAGWADCGDDLYREGKLYFGVGKSVSGCYFDVNVGWYALNVKDYGQANFTGGRVIVARKVGVLPKIEIGSEVINAPGLKYHGDLPFTSWGIIQLNDWECMCLSGGVIFPGEWDASMVMNLSGVLSSNFGYELGLQTAPEQVYGGVSVYLTCVCVKSHVSYQPKLGFEHEVGISITFE